MYFEIICITMFAILNDNSVT